MKRIVVQLHENDSSFGHGPTPYLLEVLMREWLAMGIECSVVRGASGRPGCDLLFPHLNLTVVPPAYRAFMQQYPAVVNGRVFDISKSMVSSGILHRGDPYAGPVIVKTDRNYGGLPELDLEPRAESRAAGIRDRLRGARRKLHRKIFGRVAWRDVESMRPDDYPIFPSLGAVPNAVFRNRRLVVEKFLPERDGDDYVLRYCYFLGDRAKSFALKSAEPIVKYHNAHVVEESGTPPALLAFRRKMHMDYGKIDYAVHDGQVVVFDMNKTPGGRVAARDPALQRFFAEGVWSLLRSRPGAEPPA